jgi:hypothetical protein
LGNNTKPTACTGRNTVVKAQRNVAFTQAATAA